MNDAIEVNYDRIRVCWMALKNLPLNFFNDKETQNFFSLLNDKIKMPNRNKAADMLIKEFDVMQNNVKKILNNNKSKFAFTVDGWSAKTRKSYYGITIHFIDDDWILRSIALDLKPARGKHAGSDIAQIFHNVTEFYEISEKIVGITLDNVSANTTFIEELEKILKSKSIEFDKEDQHFRCLAHIINLGVQDLLQLLEIDLENHDILDNDDSESSDDDEDEINLDDNRILNIVKKIRFLSKKIKNSETLFNKLKSCCDIKDIKFKKPMIDSKTRWNSTYEMIKIALDLKKALILLCNDDGLDLRSCQLNSQEWNLVQDMVDYLKDFKIVTEKISGEQYVTLPSSVIAINCLLDKLEKDSFSLDHKDNRDPVDETIIKAFQMGRDKILKHYNKFNWIYCVSLVLDPRIKADGLNLTSWGVEMKDQTIGKLKSLYKDYYKKYAVDTTEEPLKKKRRHNGESSLDFNVLFANEDSFSDSDLELDNYLNSPRSQPNIDILQWWKTHQKVYPILSLIARDILCVSATSVPAERMFSEAAQVVTKLRTLLNDDKITALICINLWMKSSLKKFICEVDI